MLRICSSILATPARSDSCSTGTATRSIYIFAANTFTDANGDALTYITTPLPSGLTFNAEARHFAGTVAGGRTGRTYVITVTASDGRGSVSDSFDIVVEGFIESAMAPSRAGLPAAGRGPG